MPLSPEDSKYGDRSEVRSQPCGIDPCIGGCPSMGVRAKGDGGVGIGDGLLPDEREDEGDDRRLDGEGGDRWGTGSLGKWSSMVGEELPDDPARMALSPSRSAGWIAIVGGERFEGVSDPGDIFCTQRGCGLFFNWMFHVRSAK